MTIEETAYVRALEARVKQLEAHIAIAIAILKVNEQELADIPLATNHQNAPDVFVNDFDFNQTKLNLPDFAHIQQVA